MTDPQARQDAEDAQALRELRQLERLGDRENVDVLLPDALDILDPPTPEPVYRTIVSDRPGEPAQCLEHSLEFDPTQSLGCEQCRREEKQRRSKARRSRGGVFLVASAASVLALMLAARLFGFGRTNNSVLDQILPTDASTSTFTLDPNPYREAIETIEEVIYRGSPDADIDGDLLDRSAHDLAETIRFTGKASLRHSLADRIAHWGTTIGTSAEKESGMVDAGFARSQWEALRAEVFVPVDWFLTADPRPTPEPGETPLPTVRPTPRIPIPAETITALYAVETQLPTLIAQGWKETEALGNAEGLEPGSAQALELAGRWYLWTQDWSERVRSLRIQLPSLEPEAPTELLQARQHLETSLQELANLARLSTEGGIPSLNERRAPLHKASQALALAKESLKNL